MIGSKQGWGLLILISILFQAVGILPNADTQPNFIVISLLFIVIFISNLKYETVDIVSFIICYISLFIAFLLQSEFILMKYFLTYTVSLLSFFIILVLIKNKVLVLSSPFLLTVTSIYVFVGAVQFFIPDFMSFLVSRSVEAAFSFAESGRGNRSLTGEPAHLGKIFVILNVLFLFNAVTEGGRRKTSSYLIFTSLAFLLANIAIARSFYSIFAHASLILILIMFVNKKLFIILSVVFFIVLGFFITIINNVETDIRFVNILKMVINNPSELLNQGAMRRVFNIPLSLNNLQHFDWFGAGSNPKTFRGTLTTPIGTLHYSGLNRAYGGIIEFVLKFGVFSFPLLIIYFTLLFRIAAQVTYLNGVRIHLGLFFAFCVFVLTFQDGALAKPLPILLLMYVYVKREDLQR
jgi:hypothetical protein